MLKAVSQGSSEDIPSDAVLRRIRVPFVQRATLSDGGGQELLFLIDLGLAGAFAEREQPLALGQWVTLSFCLPGNEIPITAGCRVAWWNPPGDRKHSKALPAGGGLQFVEISPADRERVKRHLVEHLSRQGGLRRFHRPWPRSEQDGEEPA
jgi:Tfp pilus assembly protein PilZ